MFDTLVAIVSGQPDPVLAPFLSSAFNAKQALLITTPETRAGHRHEHLEAVLKPRGIRVESLHLQSSTDLEVFQRELQGAIKQRQQRNERIAFNASGGTKLLAIAAFEVAYSADVPTFYVDVETIHWYGDPADKRLPGRIMIEQKLPEFLRGHGLLIESKGGSSVKPEWQELARRWVDESGKPHHGIGKLNYLACAAQDKLWADMVPKDIEDTQLQLRLEDAERAGLLGFSGTRVVFTSEDARALCNGLWLEYHALRELQKLKQEDIGIADIEGSVELSRVDGRMVRNEIDALCLHNNRLLLIECKTINTQTQRNVDRVMGALFKLAELRRNIGGIRADALLVSYEPIAQVDRERARLLNIHVCEGQQLRQLGEQLQKVVVGKTNVL
jgi:hypothetical protein